MIIQGSMNYTTCGRKMNSAKSRGKRRQQIWHWQTTELPNYRIDTKEYASVPLGDPNPNETVKKDKSYTSSSRHTIAPAYNKGAYQVITKENVKDIGR